MTLLNLFFLLPWVILAFFAARYVASKYFDAGRRANAVAGAIVGAFAIGALLPNFHGAEGAPVATAGAPPASPSSSPSPAAVERSFEGDPNASHAPPVAWDETQGRFTQSGRPLRTGDVWRFDGTADHFTASTGARAQPLPNGGLLLSNDTYGSFVRSPAQLGVAGRDYPIVLVRLTRTKAGAGWAPTIYYQTDRHGESAQYFARVYRGKNPHVGETVTLVFDMSKLAGGSLDWTSSRIQQFRLQTDDQPGGEFTIHEVALSQPLFR